jgi:hypothetical protein
MEPIFAAIFKAIGRFLAEGGGEFRIAFEALGAVSLLEWMYNHIAITLGAAAVLAWGFLKGAAK